MISVTDPELSSLDDRWIYSALITDLEPDSTYQFQIEYLQNYKFSKEYSFRSLKSAGSTVIAVISNPKDEASADMIN